MNVIAEIQRINAAELENGSVGTSASWHAKYSDSAWCYVGNLPHQLTEGDVICILSQFGEVEDINLVREDDTGKSRGFAFVKYEDARSCVLAVDNFAGSKVLGRSIRVDHVEKYRLPKHLLEKEEAAGRTDPGHAYDDKELANQYTIDQGHDLFAPPTNTESDTKDDNAMTKEERREAKRKRKEARDAKRREKEERKRRHEDSRRKRRAKQMRKEEDDGRSRKKKKKRRRRSRSISSRSDSDER